MQAASELGRSGGYEAVQIRAVASHAGVALGTVYHYFNSKDHLLAALMVQWAKEFKAEVEAEPPLGASLADRMVNVLCRAHGGMQSDSTLAGAVVKALASSGDDVARCQRELHQVMTDVLSVPFPAGFPDTVRIGTVRTIEHVWFSTLVSALMGWVDFDVAYDELQTAVHLLLDHHPV